MMNSKELDNLRHQINNIDDEMIELFKRRMDIVRGVAEFKIQNDMEVLDKSREDYIINKYTENIEDTGLKKEITEFIKAMLKISRNAQSEIIKVGTPNEKNNRTC